MSVELNLRFPNPNQVVVTFDEVEEILAFENPLTVKDRDDIRWYLEVYSAHYTTDVDDARAHRIEAKLPDWGVALFNAVFDTRATQRAFNAFQDTCERGRLLTISARHPDILSLPWELLRDSVGTYLVHDNPRISVRRRLAGAGGGRRSLQVRAKETINILFVISRPSDIGFIDPRGEAQAIIRAIEETKGRVTAEFLRPATLDALIERLEDESLPAVDILHFDGHGVYDTDGQHWEDAKLSDLMLTKLKEDNGMGSATGADTGYLLFEETNGKKALISAETLGDMLNRQTVGLIVLSACQSAMMNAGKGKRETEKGENAGEAAVDVERAAMGSVAARLTHSGIPAVLAMTHSVLVSTTQQLFGQFYKNLTRGQGVGEALDNARRHLYRNSARGERIRGTQTVTLKLQDWFLPVLYQAGKDIPLLTMAEENKSITPSDNISFGNLPELQEAGFWGRSRELWSIERAFVTGTRRISLVGFGGQGKTFLAQEVGRWLYQTDLFQYICFVDYASFQGTDAVGLAVSTLGTVLNESLVDADAATAALAKMTTLLILDNLEVLETDALNELLDVAQNWSQVGQCRVLLTSRRPDFEHSGYKTEGSRMHIRLTLRGLGNEKYPADALDYFQALMALPPAPKVALPERSALVNLFKLVDFHPLSIGLLARQLKNQRIGALGTRLEMLLAEIDETDKNKSLVASLKLSLDRLSPEAQRCLSRLGVFEGGAFEDNLLAITGLGLTDQQVQTKRLKRAIEKLQEGKSVSKSETGLSSDLYQKLLRESPEKLSALLERINDIDVAVDVSENTWPELKQSLVAGGLLQPEQIPGVNVPFLKFHPTLAPMLWSQLSEELKENLTTRHRQRYYLLSGKLCQENLENPLLVRKIARLELQNLLAAIKRTLTANVIEEAVDFANNIGSFLSDFGLEKDRLLLSKALNKIKIETGSQSWFLALSEKGDMLHKQSQHAEAIRVFKSILEYLGNEPSYSRGITLHKVGQCFFDTGQIREAAKWYEAGLSVAERLDQSQLTTDRLKSTLYLSSAEIQVRDGAYGEAENSLSESLSFARNAGDITLIAVVQSQTASLKIEQGNPAEAIKLLRSSIIFFNQLDNANYKAVSLHQLGVAYTTLNQLDEAERCYREASELRERNNLYGGRNGAEASWYQLAIVSEKLGRVQDAVQWYEKVLSSCKVLGDLSHTAIVLTNLARLQQEQVDESGTCSNLNVARERAEEALEIAKTIDPEAIGVWKIYEALEGISLKQNRIEQAKAYKKRAIEATLSFSPQRYQLLYMAPLICSSVDALYNEEMQNALVAVLSQSDPQGEDLLSAIRQIWNGERDAGSLTEALSLFDSLFVILVLRGIANPNALKQFFSSLGNAA